MKKQCMGIALAYLLGSLLLAGCRGASSSTEKNMENWLQWEKLPDLPGAPSPSSLPPVSAENLAASLGVSAPFAGIYHGKLWVAGGCNFPDKPVTEGGSKRYYEDIFCLDLAASTPPAAWQWAGRLPYPVAYGATVSTPEGLICIGGNNADSSLVQVTLLTWDETTGQIETTSLLALPAPMDNLAAAADGAKIYVAGGNVNGRPARSFLCLDRNHPEKGWEQLPDFPGAARVQPVLAAQQSSEGSRIYLAGGFQPILDGEAPVVPTDLLAYNPQERSWTKETELPALDFSGEELTETVASTGRPVTRHTFTGGCCVAEGGRYLLFLGGVNYDRFLAAIDRPRQIAQAEAAADKVALDSLQAEAKAYMHHPVEWYRFNTSLWRYDTFTKKWNSLGAYEQLARAGAGAVCSGKTLIVVNGELKPGIRTPAVNRVTLP